jgi:hypothetical protein
MRHSLPTHLAHVRLPAVYKLPISASAVAQIELQMKRNGDSISLGNVFPVFSRNVRRDILRALDGRMS